MVKGLDVFRSHFAAYAAMLELFCRIPDALQLPDGAHLTPIPVDEAVSSLSAILMDGDYYAFIHANKQEVDRLPVARPECLIPLKAHAWMDLSARKAAGDHVDERDIRKHRNDVFRLCQVIDPAWGRGIQRILDACRDAVPFARRESLVGLPRAEAGERGRSGSYPTPPAVDVGNLTTRRSL